MTEGSMHPVQMKIHKDDVPATLSLAHRLATNLLYQPSFQYSSICLAGVFSNTMTTVTSPFQKIPVVPKKMAESSHFGQDKVRARNQSCGTKLY